MMNVDPRIERERNAALGADLDRVGEFASEGSVTAILTTTTAEAYPTSAGMCYACMITGADGTEVEGSLATFTPDGDQIVGAYNLGSRIPDEGTRFLGHLHAGLWFFTWNG